MKWGSGWEVGLNREIDMQFRATLQARELQRPSPDPQREAYLRKRCTCGSGLADGLCVNCWPQ
jgi:hypothetical protein